MNLLLVQTGADAAEYAAMEDGRLTEYACLRAGATALTEGVWLGKVSRVMKSLSAVFVRLSPQLEGFLPLSEIPFETKAQPGDELIVQVRKPPVQGKGPFLSCDVALAGRLAILLPLSRARHVSGRVEDREERERLLSVAGELAPQGMGLVMRAQSAGLTRDAAAAEVAELLAQWTEILKKAAASRAPALLRGSPEPLARLLRDLAYTPEKIVANAEPASLPAGIPLERCPQPFALWGVREQLRKALRRRIYLKSGGTLVVDPCEAMTVIDVNTAQSSSGRDKEASVLALNLEAAQEIARVLRLRRAGGIVLIDFIGMQQEGNREKVLAALEAALKKDRVKTVVHGFTSLGLVEMTRRKADEPLDAETLSLCPACGGTGQACSLPGEPAPREEGILP